MIKVIISKMDAAFSGMGVQKVVSQYPNCEDGKLFYQKFCQKEYWQKFEQGKNGLHVNEL
jgi:hypothetical protein